jgi:hypothetical protein
MTVLLYLEAYTTICIFPLEMGSVSDTRAEEGGVVFLPETLSIHYPVDWLPSSPSSAYASFFLSYILYHVQLAPGRK